ncbi:Leucyl-tRNA synthetase [Spironucleus salmonicida]|uniref:leucine--tRNA ligase n=1 Tax=Spironucleus salmonicida TaxID=348837 RepID=V6LYY1_9EUKA|nr:Leucyl-tRNA synthetase [Spironucleus salmonicida]|eukprot:EST49483.1 Leucyl-tRNA synthetase [Spironucleus salmonicida]
MEARNILQQICNKYQAEWEAEKLFEATPDDRKKYMVTFPYPYMNGKLHLGHLFTASKCDFAAGYHTIKGENVLFPFAFHVTGQPICGAAKKLENELKNKNNDKDIDIAQQINSQLIEKDIVVGQFRSKKSKAVSKASGKSQYDILKDLGIPEQEIPNFIDPYYWVDYFPPICKQDMMQFGGRIDWRRNFYTSDKNPCYDKFIRWQFNTLKRKGFIKFGERFTIWSPIDQQPCLDHDRASGEGVQSQEYTIVLTELLKNETNNAKIYDLVNENDKIYLPCATLRPETMCGQTNVWVKPDGEYYLYRIEENKVIVSGQHAGQNMAYQHQNNGKPIGETDVVCQILGQELINCLVKAPLTPLSQIPVLPLLTILMDKGTGVVTSVPSDAPDDYAAFMDIINNNDGVVEKYNIDINLVKNIEIIDIIEIPEIGVGAARKLCIERGVKSQHDKEKLKEIKDICYKQGFYEGIMIAGPFSGKKVQDCKILCRDLLIKEGLAYLYAEPESIIMSRSGCECVVALTEQWYLDYGEEVWKQKAQKALASLDTFSDEIRKQFERVLDWLKQWAVSRTFGLGTKIPWDEKYIIESLSDSTIYNAYYTIAHILQNDSLDASSCPIPQNLINDEFFDYIFDLTKICPDTLTPFKDLVEEMRASFLYFYPVNLRCSGKDLVNNHLTFFIYTHVAIWDDVTKWPLGIRANGHLLLNDEKMSKSSGNFLTAEEAIIKYTPDGVRFALADAGDAGDDANFKTETADQAILKITQLLKASQNLLDISENRDNTVTSDHVFQAQMFDAASKADCYFERCRFRDGMLACFGEMNKIRELYIQSCDYQNLKPIRKFSVQFLELQAKLISVVIPHTAEEIWQAQLKNPKSIMKSPIQDNLAELARSTSKYIKIYTSICASINRLKIRWQDSLKPKKGSKDIPQKPKKGVIYVATEFENWQAGVCDFLRDLEDGILEKSAAGLCRVHAMEKLGMEAKDSKRLMKFIADMIGLYKIEGADALVTKMPYDEKVTYLEYQFMIKSSLQLDVVEVYIIGEGPMPAEKCSAAAPGRPIIFFE